MDPSLPAVAQGSSLVETGMTEKNEAKIQNRNFILPHLDNKQVSFDYLVEITKVEKERLKKLSDITESTDFYFKRPEINKEILAWKKSTLEDAMQKLAELKEFFGTLTEEAFLRYNIEKGLQEFIAEKGYDNGSVLWPLRVALTGLAKSTGPFDVISIIAQGLGREEVIKRLEI
jgi:glutamyl/glutaminyl-tRNA synthetase